MIARGVVILVPFALVAFFFLRGRAVTLGRLPAYLFGAGIVSASEELAMAQSTRRLRSARATGGFVGFLAFAVPVLVLRRSLQINFSAMLAGAVVGIVVAQWWVNRIPRRTRRSAPLNRRRLVDLVGLPPLILFGLTTALAVLGDIGWLVLRSAVGSAHRFSNGQPCPPPPVRSVQHHLLAWTVLAPVLLISLGGAMMILRRAVDQTVPVAGDVAIRAAAARTALGCGMLFAGGHAVATYADSTVFTSPFGCLPPDPWWYVVSGPLFLLTVPVLCWCVGVYVLAPARRPKPLAVPRTPEVVAPA